MTVKQQRKKSSFSPLPRRAISPRLGYVGSSVCCRCSCKTPAQPDGCTGETVPLINGCGFAQGKQECCPLMGSATPRKKTAIVSAKKSSKQEFAAFLFLITHQTVKSPPAQEAF